MITLQEAVQECIKEKEKLLEIEGEASVHAYNCNQIKDEEDNCLISKDLW